MTDEAIKALRDYVRAEIIAMQVGEMRDLPDDDTSWQDGKEAEANEKAKLLLSALADRV